MVIYNIGMWAYGAIVRIASLFNRKAKLWVNGRKRIFERLEKAIGKDDRIIWVHCASLGEFEQGRPVIEAIKAAHPEYKILLTFFSPSGYEIRKNYDGADYIFYLPNDTPRNAKRFLKITRPEITVFIKYEFWLNYLKQLRKSGCRTFIVSAIFRRNSVFFKPYGGMFRRALATFERLFVQNKESEELLAGIGIRNVTVAGDTRFDRVASIAAGAKKLDIIERFTAGAKTFIAGSTWPPDESLIARLISDYPEIKFIIAPHEIEQSRIDSFMARCPRHAVRYTECMPDTGLDTPQVLIIDTIGILSSAYQYADYGYIGGGFGTGIHNTLEAATFGLPVAFGPNYRKFREACELISAGAARSVANYEELRSWLEALVSDGDFYGKAKTNALSYISQNTGATKTITDYIFNGSI